MIHHPNFSDLRGLADTVRAFATAVREDSNILLIAGPGDGAVAIARRAVGLLPELVVPSSEARAIDAIREAAGLEALEPRRPFRAPHHTVSYAGMFGRVGTVMDQDNKVRERTLPGELELATHGVLMLDEVTEFSRPVIEMVGSRLGSHRSATLIARAQPCPCGMANHPTRKCVCTEAQCDRWVGRLGRIVADLGIDTIIEVPHLTRDKRANGERCPSTSDLLVAGGAK